MSLNCIVVTPAETAVETEASSITLPLFDGNKGVMSDHAPMIGRLGNGELSLLGTEGPSRFYIEGGFVQVLDNTVSILTNRVIEVSDLDAESLQQELKDALACLETTTKTLIYVSVPLKLHGLNYVSPPSPESLLLN